MRTVLFICTGNTCRSPMAEALFRERMGHDTDWLAQSAGMYAAEGAPASPEAIETLRQIGIDLTSHCSRPLTNEMAFSADLIVTMTAGHRDELLDYLPELGHKVFLIKSFGTSRVAADVSDPFGGSLNVYRKTRDEIDQALSDLILFLRTGK